MGKSFYTFIVVPNASSRLHKLKLPVQVLHILAIIGMVSFFVAVGLGFSYAKMAFKAADYDKLQAENTDLKVQKKNLEVTALKLGEKISNMETIAERIQKIIETDNLAKRGTLNIPGVGGSKVDYPTAELLGSSNLKGNIDVLKDRTTAVESRLSQLEQVAQKQATGRRVTPSIWPVRGTITSYFGSRPDPFSGEGELHLGVDISALLGTQVRAPADGKVIYAQRQAAYGNLIIIDHGNGLTTRHGHLHSFVVKVGQKVRKNELIGYVGTSGRSTAPHLHYEVRVNDRPVNPNKYLPKGS